MSHEVSPEMTHGVPLVIHSKIKIIDLADMIGLTHVDECDVHEGVLYELDYNNKNVYDVWVYDKYLQKSKCDDIEKVKYFDVYCSNFETNPPTSFTDPDGIVYVNDAIDDWLRKVYLCMMMSSSIEKVYVSADEIMIIHREDMSETTESRVSYTKLGWDRVVTMFNNFVLYTALPSNCFYLCSSHFCYFDYEFTEANNIRDIGSINGFTEIHNDHNIEWKLRNALFPPKRRYTYTRDISIVCEE